MVVAQEIIDIFLLFLTELLPAFGTGIAEYITNLVVVGTGETQTLTVAAVWIIAFVVLSIIVAMGGLLFRTVTRS